ncbi:MAG: hypothetical protein AAFU57_03025 [Bacteroidota bacterium]
MPLRNSKFYYILIFLLLGNKYTQAQQFVKVGGQASDIAISPKDGRVYAIDKNKKRRQLNNAKWNLFTGQNRISKGLNQVIGIGMLKLGIIRLTSFQVGNGTRSMEKTTVSFSR